METKNIPEFLIIAAENSVSTILLETNNQNNKDKIIELSSLSNNFIEKLYKTVEKIKNGQIIDVAKDMNYIYDKTKLNKDIINKIKDEINEYPEYFFTSALYSINENIYNLELSKNFQKEHIDLLLHLSNMIGIQMILSQDSSNLYQQ